MAGGGLLGQVTLWGRLIPSTKIPAMEVRAQFLTLPGQGWGAATASDADISPPGRVTLVMLETRVSQDHRDRR